MTQPYTYTVHEVAPVLRVTPATVRALIRRGELPAVRVGRHWRVSASALATFINGTTR